jgi:hypothetical protein
LRGAGSIWLRVFAGSEAVTVIGNLFLEHAKRAAKKPKGLLKAPDTEKRSSAGLVPCLYHDIETA